MDPRVSNVRLNTSARPFKNRFFCGIVYHFSFEGLFLFLNGWVDIGKEKRFA